MWSSTTVISLIVLSQSSWYSQAFTSTLSRPFLPRFAPTNVPSPLYGAFDDFLTGQDDSSRQRKVKQYLEIEVQPRVQAINDLEETIEDLDDEQLQAKTVEFRQRLAEGEDVNGKLLEEAFAVVREAAWYVGEKILHIVTHFEQARPRTPSLRRTTHGWHHFASR